MIGLTIGQQSWLRLLNIEHHQVMAGTSASMAPGYEDAERLEGIQITARLLGESQGQIGERRLIFRRLGAMAGARPARAGRK